MKIIIPKIDKTVKKTEIIKTDRQQYKLGCHNKDTCMGGYYSEDDWEIVAYGDTLKELYQQLIPFYFTRECCPETMLSIYAF